MRREIEGQHRTPFDDLKLIRLPNWGRWGRQDACRPDDQRLGSALAGKMGRSDKDDYEAAPEGVPVPIDDRDADLLDGFIQQLPRDHRDIIRRAYYRREDIYRAHLDASVRALQDVIDANRAVVRRMRGA